jgi:lysophospholipid acyltransferase (LPLAT)-like uncharacterized protein
LDSSKISRNVIFEVIRFVKTAVMGLYGFVTAVLMWIYFLILRITCRFEIEGEENIDHSKNFILVIWHRDFPCVLSCSKIFRHPSKIVWMMHPLPYMKPFHFFSRWIGVDEFVLGSSGHSGLKALDQIVEKVKAGYSTQITPDGPAGPAFEMKSGILKLAFRSGVPVIPLSGAPSIYIPFWKAWDRKRLPLPFAHIKLKFSAPVFVTSENDSEARKSIIEGMNLLLTY